MLTEICEYLRNWFCEDSDIYVGTISIGDGIITAPNCNIQTGQYVRIVNSVFNDGVIKYGEDELTDETFEGAVWLMRVPKAVVNIAQELQDWQDKYGGTDSKAISPFNSESFAGYSYSKSSGYSSDGSQSSTWQGIFGARLAGWRKL